MRWVGLRFVRLLFVKKLTQEAMAWRVMYMYIVTRQLSSAGYCYRRLRSVVCLSLCVCVGHAGELSKTDESIVMRLG